uniref:Uncharacterized protein LOC113790187 n=1 Tax=Dermatophagoides pteronyssinus TaxID=6956 RepID=A0A6P6XRZ5_DERPT|nr:uncharacterized protein LOC113790187 [Dermatophagoides pteronyssinus]
MNESNKIFVLNSLNQTTKPLFILNNIKSSNKVLLPSLFKIRHFFLRSNNKTENDYNETYEISLWPCLRQFSPNSISHVGQFYPVDEGNSMYTIDPTNNHIHLFRPDSNKIFIGSIPDKIIHLYSQSSDYLYILDKNYRLYFYPANDDPNSQIKIIMDGIVKFRSNGKQCLGLDCEGDLLVWYMAFSKNQSGDNSVEFLPWKFQSFNEIFGEHSVVLDFDCGKSNGILLSCSSDYHSQAIHVWRRLTENGDVDFLQKILISDKQFFWNVTAGFDTFILMRESILHVYKSQFDVFNDQPVMITGVPKINACYSIPSTDIYVLISNSSWYIYNLQTGQKIRTLLRSLPDLYTFYGRYPSSPPSFCIINRQICLQEILPLRLFNDPSSNDFKIQIPMDRYTTRTIYLTKSKLNCWKIYFNTLFQQHPNLNETSDLLFNIGYIEHFYYYKSIFIKRLPPFIEQDEHICEGIRILNAKHNIPYTFHLNQI